MSLTAPCPACEGTGTRTFFRDEPGVVCRRCKGEGTLDTSDMTLDERVVAIEARQERLEAEIAALREARAVR